MAERGDPVLVEAEYLEAVEGRVRVRFPWGYAVVDAPAEITAPPTTVHPIDKEET